MLHRVSYLVSLKTALDEALAALMNMRGLKSLELIIRNFVLSPDQLRVIGEHLDMHRTNGWACCVRKHGHASATAPSSQLQRVRGPLNAMRSSLTAAAPLAAWLCVWVQKRGPSLRCAPVLPW